MRVRFLSCLILAPLVGCASPDVSTTESVVAEIATPAVPSLEQIWTANGFSSPEGVALAPDGNYLVSNVGIGGGAAKDGDGFITKVSPDGEVITPYWVAKMNGPKGMAVLDGVLYAADTDIVMMVDAEKGGLGEKIPVEGAASLNDVTTWNGAVYVSDSGAGRIYRIADGAATVWLEDARFGGINGLLGDGDRLLVTTMKTGSLFSVSKDGEITEIANGMINADGLGLVPGGGYLVSSWPGQIHYVAEDGTVTTLLDTTEAGILQNDLTVFGDTVIVPNWEPGTVTAWKVVR